MSILPSGKYNIFSAASRFLVARKPAEDKSLRPKGIYTLDPSTPVVTWDIQHVGGDRYKLQNGKAPVGDQDGLLWAFLTKEEQNRAGEWRIQDISYQGKNYWVIVRPDQSRGWVASSEDPDQQQIAVRPLIIQPSYPPRYPLNEVFIIIKPAA